MYLYQFRVGDVVEDTDGKQVLMIVENLSRNKTKATVITSDNTSVNKNEINKTYTYPGHYGTNWRLSNKVPEVKKPVTKLDTLKKELQQAKVNVEKIEASIAKVLESLALKPGTMYKSDDHFGGQAAIFMCLNGHKYEFYIGGEFINIEVNADDLEKFIPLTLPNQRKMAKTVVDFFEGRIPNN